MPKPNVTVRKIDVAELASTSASTRIEEILAANVKLPPGMHKSSLEMYRTVQKAGFRTYLGSVLANAQTARKRGFGLWVAEIDGEIVGYAIGHALQEGDAKRFGVRSGLAYYLDDAQVDPRHQRKGVVTALTKARLEHAVENGFTLAATKVNSENSAARAHILKEGFGPEPVHEETGFDGISEAVYHWFVKKLGGATT